MIEFLYPTPSPKFFFIQYISAYCKADTSFLVSNILKVASTVCSLYVFNRLTVWPTDRPTNGHGRPTDQRTRPTDRADQLTKRHGRPKRLTDYLTGWLSTDRMTDRLLPESGTYFHVVVFLLHVLLRCLQFFQFRFVFVSHPPTNAIKRQFFNTRLSYWSWSNNNRTRQYNSRPLENSRPRLPIFDWFASGQFGFLFKIWLFVLVVCSAQLALHCRG